MRKLRPKLSLRVVLCLVTLAAAYFACWKPTKDHARSVIGSYSGTSTGFPIVEHAAAVLPLLVYQEEIDVDSKGNFIKVRHYYVWLFGLKLQLPMEAPRPAGGPHHG